MSKTSNNQKITTLKEWIKANNIKQKIRNDQE